jgi:hypothetical protein
LLCQKFVADFEEKLVAFQHYLTGLHKWIITSRAKQEVPTKFKCAQYAIWLYYWLHVWKMCGDQYVWNGKLWYQHMIASHHHTQVWITQQLSSNCLE